LPLHPAHVIPETGMVQVSDVVVAMISNLRISQLLRHEGTKNTNLLFFVTLVLRLLVALPA
jgi:hypothetical protein